MNLGWRVRLGLAIAFCASFCGTRCFASSSWAEHKVVSGQFPIRTACMMPAQGQLAHWPRRGPAELARASDIWSAALRVFVESHFKTDGLAIVEATNPLSSGASDAEITSVIQQLQQNFDTVSTVLDKKPKQVSKSAYTLGDQIAMLPCAAGSDVVVFIRGQGAVLQDSALVTIAFADAKTGEILAMIRFRNGPEEFLSDLEDAFGPQFDRELANINLGTARKLEREREFGPGSQ